MLACLPTYAQEATASAEGEVVSSAEVSSADVTEPTPHSGVMRDITATQLVNEINLGWNLGEALESWASDAGYDDYHNSNAYQFQLRYDDAEGTRSTSVATSFNDKNQCTISWATGLIDSEPNVGIGKIGFEVWNRTVEEPTEVTVNVTKATLTRRNKVVINLDELLGEHTLTISKYGTIAFLSDKWPSNISRTYGITDGTYEVSVELVEFQQKDYNKTQYFETLWHNPLTTQEMITEVKRAGFNAVRIPITFFNHIPKDGSAIDAEWLDRIQEIADFAISQDMYCILCLYHDGSTTGWLRVASDTDVNRYTEIWRQLAERFIDYDEHLLFQGYNELTDKDNTWDYPGENKVNWVNNLAQKFVDTVRATGGNNSQRCLVVTPYAGSHDQQIMNGFRLPNDSAYNRLIVSVNAYYPAEFSYSIESSSTDAVEWGFDNHKADMDRFMSSLDTTFVSKGIPLIITEFSSADKNNTAARTEHAGYYTAAAKEHGIPCFWFDDGSLFHRSTLTWSYPEIVDAMVNSTSMHVDKLSVDIPIEETYYTGESLYPNIRVYYYGGDVLSGSDLVSGSDVVLTQGVDYSLKFSDNTEIGKATVILTGLGTYSGFRRLTFEITKKPVEIGLLTSLAQADPNLPLVILVSFPVLLFLIGLGLFQLSSRKERFRVFSTISSSLEGAKIADTSDIDSNPDFFDFSYLRIRPEREPREKAGRGKAAEALVDEFSEVDELDAIKVAAKKKRASRK